MLEPEKRKRELKADLPWHKKGKIKWESGSRAPPRWDSDCKGTTRSLLVGRLAEGGREKLRSRCSERKLTGRRDLAALRSEFKKGIAAGSCSSVRGKGGKVFRSFPKEMEN